MRTVVLYQGGTDVTQQFAKEIGAYMEIHGIESRVMSIAEGVPQTWNDCHYLLLGCETNGLNFFNQHPDKAWVDYVHALPEIKYLRVGLFTTYKIATGGMFKKMRHLLADKTGHITIEIKSRNGRLSEKNKQVLDRFIAEA